MPTKRRQPHGNGTFWFEIFIVVLMLSGYALYATGHFENPFSAFGFRGFSDAGNFVANRVSFSDDPLSIFMSQTGDVLFNVWYICATTAVVIVVQKVFNAVVVLVRRLRSTNTEERST